MEAVLEAFEYSTGLVKDVYKMPAERKRLEFVQGGGARSDLPSGALPPVQSGGATKGPLIKLNAGFAVRNLAHISKTPSESEKKIVEDIKNLDFIADEGKLFKWLGLDNTFLEKKIRENPSSQEKFYKFWRTVVTADVTDGWHLMTGKEAQAVSNYLSYMAEKREAYLRSVAIQYLRGEEVAEFELEYIKGKEEKEIDLGEPLVKEGEKPAGLKEEDIYDLKTYEAIEARVLDKVEEYRAKFYDYAMVIDYYKHEYVINTIPSDDILKKLNMKKLNEVTEEAINAAEKAKAEATAAAEQVTAAQKARKEAAAAAAAEAAGAGAGAGAEAEAEAEAAKTAAAAAKAAAAKAAAAAREATQAARIKRSERNKKIKIVKNIHDEFINLFRKNILGFFDNYLRPIRNDVEKEVGENYTKLSAVRKKINSLKTSSPPDTSQIQNLEKLVVSANAILDKLKLSASLLFYCGEIFLKLLNTEPDVTDKKDTITLHNYDIERLNNVLGKNYEDYYKNPSLIPEKKESLESRSTFCRS